MFHDNNNGHYDARYLYQKVAQSALRTCEGIQFCYVSKCQKTNEEVEDRVGKGK